MIPARARIVVIGGGVGGASIAYHLAERGETDVVLARARRADQRVDVPLGRAGRPAARRPDADPDEHVLGRALPRVCRTATTRRAGSRAAGSSSRPRPERLAEIRRQISWATHVRPAAARDLGRRGRRAVPVDGSRRRRRGGLPRVRRVSRSRPSSVRRWLAGLASWRVVVSQHTRVLAIDTVDVARRSKRGFADRTVSRVRTDRGDIECEVVVDAGGIYAAEIARMVGVRVPVVPLSHQYVVTDALPAGDLSGSRRPPLPTLRDPDLLVYWRPEVDGSGDGGVRAEPARPGGPAARRTTTIPADFNATLLPESWDRFEEIAANAAKRRARDGRRRAAYRHQRPGGVHPGQRVLSRRDRGRLGSSSRPGFCAHGIAGAGGIGKMMAEWVARWGAEPRPLAHGRQPLRAGVRVTVVHDAAHPGDLPARTTTSAIPGWSVRRGGRCGPRPSTSGIASTARASARRRAGSESTSTRRNSALGDESCRPTGWPGRDWSPATGAEHHATRTTAGLFDETSFAKLSVSGPDAAAFLLEWVCDNHVARGVGDVTYTQALNVRGGIESDFTVTRRRHDEFLVVTGTAYGTHDQAWLRKRPDSTASTWRSHDVTGSLVCFALWGPAARDILAGLTPADVSDEAFPFMTAQQITVGEAPAWALRVSFTGEHGWELYASNEYGATLWGRLSDAGSTYGLRPAGYRALESLRLEKGYRVWSTDLTPETNPYEAGLGFCVKLAKPGGFLGADALRAVKAAGVSRRLCCLALDDPRSVVLGRRAGAGRRSGGRSGHVGRLRIHGRDVDRLRLPAGGIRCSRYGGHRRPVRRARRRHRGQSGPALGRPAAPAPAVDRLSGRPVGGARTCRAAGPELPLAVGVPAPAGPAAAAPYEGNGPAAARSAPFAPATVRTVMRIRSGRKRSEAYSIG